jgi:hypothetical protein
VSADWNKQRRKRSANYRPQELTNATPQARETVDPALLCGPRRKLTYGSKSAARRAARHVFNRYGETSWPYRCTHGCDFWHLTTQPQRPKGTK